MGKIIGVAGGSGSGKTYLAKTLSSRLVDAVILPLDSYYKDQRHIAPEERDLLNYDSPEVLDVSLFKEHLEALRDGKKVEVPRYDFVTHTRFEGTRTLKPAKYIIAEGILIYHFEDILPLFDYKVYVDADSDVRLARRLLRDEKERGREPFGIIRQYLATVRPMHIEYVEPTKDLADFVFTNNGNEGLDQKALSELLERVKNA